ncbi:tail fiber protein [Ravibacter arvi]|uniref:Tail fiber protein n=1 Tax=Ravibacter arvi TaxID=2051041 RepID=A0ABP8M5J7_9BACT
MEGTIGEIRLFAGNFPPLTWAFCDGSLVSIAQQTALFAILGTTYGGDGQNTFALPDLRGRLPVGTGQGPGLSNVELGQMTGMESTTLLVTTMPPHVHQQSASGNEPTQNTASGAALASNGRSTNPPMPNVYTGTVSQVSMGQTTGVAGGGQPFSVIQPILTTNFIICMEGIFPSRN